MSEETDQEYQEFRRKAIAAGLAALPQEMKAQALAELDGTPSHQATPLPPKKTLRDAMANAAGSGLSLGPEEISLAEECYGLKPKSPTVKPNQ